MMIRKVSGQSLCSPCILKIPFRVAGYPETNELLPVCRPTIQNRGICEAIAEDYNCGSYGPHLWYEARPL
jgi:hypothetical protein